MSAITSAKAEDKIQPIQVMDFPTDQIDPSPFQARKHFPQEGIDEMAASVRLHGIIQPLIVRVANEVTGRLELVCGERRWRGAKLAVLEHVPVIVRELSDTQAEEIMLIENLQREDLTESEEANGYERMLKLRGPDSAALYTVETLAAKLNKSLAHITARLKLLLCPKELIEAVDEGRVSVTTAMLVGRIPDPKARAACAKRVLEPETQDIPLNYVQTKELIRDRFVVQLNKADFDLHDANLVPLRKDEDGARCLGGDCTSCTFRSGNMADVEVRANASAPGKAGGGGRGAHPNMCTLPKCHAMKLDAAWREKKELALQQGKKVLDGDAARVAFSGLNGDLAIDAAYVHPDSAVNAHLGGVYVSAHWKDAAYGQTLGFVLARHPETKQVMSLYARAEAEKAVTANVEAMLAAQRKDLPEAGTIVESVSLPDGTGGDAPSSAPDDEAAARDAADKAAKLKEAEQQKVDKIAVQEAVGDLINLITAKGVEHEFYDHFFQMALSHSGADGMFFLGHFFEIKLPEGSDRGGRVYEEAIIALVRERAQTPNAWLAYTTVALIARQVKWNGVSSDDLEACLKLNGVKLADIKRRAVTLRAAEKKAGKSKEPKPKAQGTSTDPVDVSTDKESSLTQAADALAGEDRVVLKEYTADAVQTAFLIEHLLELEIPVTEPNAHGVFVKRACFNMQVSKSVTFGFDLVRTANGQWGFGFSHEAWPPHVGGGRNASIDELCGTRAEAVHAAADLLLKQFQSRGDAPGKHKKAQADVLSVLQSVKWAAGTALDNDEPSAPAPAAGGPSASEVANGVQGSKLGKPERFREEDVASAAKCIAAGTTDTKVLLGPKPKKAEKEAYNTWSRVRMQLRRSVEKLGKSPGDPVIPRDFKSDVCTRCGVMIEDDDEQTGHINGPDCAEE